MTPTGIGPATFRLVAQCLKQLRPIYCVCIYIYTVYICVYIEYIYVYIYIQYIYVYIYTVYIYMCVYIYIYTSVTNRTDYSV